MTDLATASARTAMDAVTALLEGVGDAAPTIDSVVVQGSQTGAPSAVLGIYDARTPLASLVGWLDALPATHTDSLSLTARQLSGQLTEVVAQFTADSTAVLLETVTYQRIPGAGSGPQSRRAPVKAADLRVVAENERAADPITAATSQGVSAIDAPATGVGARGTASAPTPAPAVPSATPPGPDPRITAPPVGPSGTSVLPASPSA